MHQRTGSVYLDAPPRPSRIPEKRRFSRERLAIACVGLGLVALTVASLMAGLRSLVLDPESATNAFDTTLDDPAMREELQREVATGIEDGLVGEELVAIAAAFKLNVAEEAARVAQLAVDDAGVRDELRSLAERVHSRVFVDGRAATLDYGPVTDAVLAVIEVQSPRLAAIVPADATLWSGDGGSLPDLARAADLTGPTLRYSLLAMLLIPAGFAVHPHRHRMAAWVGRWLLVLGLVSGLAAIGLPYLGGALTGYQGVAIAIRSISLRLLAPAAVTGIVGMGLASFGAVLKHREQRRVADEGAAAALGYDEPALWPQSTPPKLDLASRGLVDANHPLTNI